MAATAYRRFTEAERDAVRDRYATDGAIALAAEFGRPRSSIVSLAQRLGVIAIRGWTSEEDRQLGELRRQNLSATQIATAMGRTPASIYKRLQHEGFARLRSGDAARLTALASPRCFANLAIEVRWARRRIALGEHGWPPDLNPKEVTILESLRTRGPQARGVLSLSTGESPSRPKKKQLMAHSGRSAMARLMARGLVTRAFISFRRDRTAIYTLTAFALAHHGKFGSVRSFNEAITAKHTKSEAA